MKNTIFFAALLTLLTSLSASAQINLGIRTGLNFNTIKATEGLEAITPDYKSITAFNVGAVSEFEFGDYFAVQPELSYTVKGFRLKEQMDVNIFDLPIPIGAEAISKFGYLEMPLLLKGKIGNEVAKAYIIAGPAFGYATGGHLTTRAKAFFEFDLFDTKIDLDQVGYERWEVSGVVGAGAEFKIPSGKIFFDARYQHGFTELYDIPFVNEQWKNQGISVNAGYMLSF